MIGLDYQKCELAHFLWTMYTHTHPFDGSLTLRSSEVQRKQDAYYKAGYGYPYIVLTKYKWEK